MKVAVFGIKALPAYAGADRVVEHLLGNLDGRYPCTVYLVRGDGPTLSCAPDRHYVYLPALRGKHLGAFSFFLLSALHFLVRGGADVAHVHNADFGLFCPLLKLRRGVRVVGTFHGHAYTRAKWGGGARLFLRLSEWVFVRSCDVLTSVAPLELPGRRVHYVPNGLEPPSDAPPARPFPYERHGLRRGEYVLFACGRLDATKGLHHLLRAYRRLDDAPPLLAIGDFSHDEGYAHEIEALAAGDPRVVLHRTLLDRDALGDVLRNARVFVFPSEVEAMSMMLLEAVAARTTIVCSDIPENLVVVGDDYPYRFRSGDPDALRAALERALATPTGEALLDERYDRIAGRFQWPSIARAYEKLYDEAVGASA